MRQIDEQAAADIVNAGQAVVMARRARSESETLSVKP